MIAKITRGSDGGGLVRHLAGKGKHTPSTPSRRVVGGSLEPDADLTRQVIRDLLAPGGVPGRDGVGRAGVALLAVHR